jgi:salicylate biosynthesis isochorismate synthase/menaquinone-specific isochorismate synthase
VEVTTGTTGPEWLDAAAGARLERHIEMALRRARSIAAVTLAGATAQLAETLDPSAIVAASRLADEPWFCLEEPQRGRFALAALGSVQDLEADGPGRFAALGRRWRALAGGAVTDDPDGPPGSGLVAVGGLAFAPDGGRSPAWSGFAPASLTVPEIALCRRQNDVRLTVTVAVQPDDTVSDALARARRSLSRLWAPPDLPLLDPAPAGAYQVRSTLPPSHYEQAVARAVEWIRARRLEKVVLAREVEVHAPVEHNPAAILAVLREAFGSCYVFAVGRRDATFVAASPELLVRREGQRASTVALAGSARRSADPAVDDHLGEQLLRSEKDREENAIVARRIARALAPRSVWVTAAPEPVLVRVENIQHLARPIRAQLAEPISALGLAGLLHPTPAVGGEPRGAALQLIPALEGMDRGWYAGPVGWTDATGDGEFCVALRCALVRGRVARCYAGSGIVAESDPAAELAETEVKLEALLPVLAG